MSTPVRIPCRSGAILEGDLAAPPAPVALVIFAHGSGSSRHSPRNRYVAGILNEARLATLLLDLLTPAEEETDLRTRQHRFDIRLLAERLGDAADWAECEPQLGGLPTGYFGSSTGGGAALVAAAARPGRIRAVVSRGGRPDLAGDALPHVKAPTLLIVGGKDDVVIELNREAMAQMRCETSLHIVPGATHLFEEPGTLEQAAGAAAAWLVHKMRPPATVPSP